MVEEYRTKGPRGAAVDEDMAVSTADAAGVFVVIAFAAVFIVATVLVARRLSVEDSMIVYCSLYNVNVRGRVSTYTTTGIASLPCQI